MPIYKDIPAKNNASYFAYFSRSLPLIRNSLKMKKSPFFERCKFGINKF